MKLKRLIKIVEGLKDYYDKKRGLGHTYTMLNGVKNNDKMVVVLAYNMEYSKMICKGIKNAIPCSIQAPTQLYGHFQPLAFDNHALWFLFKEILPYLHNLKDKK